MTKTAAIVDAKPASTTKTPDGDANSGHPVVQTQKLRVGRELLDTTWRMTVPVLLFAGVGIMADIALHSKPWLTLLGAVIGFGFAAELVKRQIARSESQDASDTANTKVRGTTE